MMAVAEEKMTSKGNVVGEHRAHCAEAPNFDIRHSLFGVLEDWKIEDWKITSLVTDFYCTYIPIPLYLNITRIPIQLAMLPLL
jgi:hypothetical protein